MKRILQKCMTLLLGTVAVLTTLCASAPTSAAAKTQNASSQISDQVGLVANLYAIEGSDLADHAALQWATSTSASGYVLYRSTNAESGFVPVYEGYGNSYADNDLQVGTEYFYQLKAWTADGAIYSGVRSLTPCAISPGLNTYNNQTGSSLVYETGGYLVGDTYYSYALKRHSGTEDIYLAETTSSDGKVFGNERNVADSSQNSALESCKIESIHIEYLSHVNKVVI